MKVAWFLLSLRRKKWLILSSSDVIIGLYFTAESQNVSIDDPKPERLGAGEFGAEKAEE